MIPDPAVGIDPHPGVQPPEAGPGEPRIVGFDEYCRVILAHRSIDRIQRGLPLGYRGLRDRQTGQTWMIREETLRDAV